MMPGIMPSLLMAGNNPIYDAYVDPPSTAWFGEFMKYYTYVGAAHSGGTAPFTYAWSADGNVSILSPTSRNTEVRSSNGAPAAVHCLITDALGQSINITGGILGLAGAGSA